MSSASNVTRVIRTILREQRLDQVGFSARFGVERAWLNRVLRNRASYGTTVLARLMSQVEPETARALAAAFLLDQLNAIKAEAPGKESRADLASAVAGIETILNRAVGDVAD